MRTELVSAAAAVALLATPAIARAYCQTHTCEFDARQLCPIDPSTGCAMGGQIARWAGDCLSYAVHAEGSAAQSISAEALREVVDAGFASWSGAVCEGRGPGLMTPMFAASYRGTTRCDTVEYNCGAEPNDNIVMFRDVDSDLSANTIALSTIMANLTTGEILDVDIEINSRDFEFSTDPSEVSAGAHDLRLVINHELGHLLGLSHSRDEGSLMRAAYEGASPLPARDDARGMCNVFSVSAADPECATAPIEGAGSCVGSVTACPVDLAPDPRGCTFAAPETRARGGLPTAGGLLALLALGALRRRAG